MRESGILHDPSFLSQVHYDNIESFSRACGYIEATLSYCKQQ